MNNSLIALLCTLLMVSQCFGRLGETLDGCKLRYGSSTGQISQDQYTFSRNRGTITVHLRDGRSVREDFAPNTGGKLSEADVAELLRENAEGSTWEVMGKSAVATSYIRKDTKAVAQAARPNTQGDGNAKLAVNGVELIIKYTAGNLNK